MPRLVDKPIMDKICPDNPKYNGAHECPRCGGRSYWSCVDASTALIRVECFTGCGTFEQRYHHFSELERSQPSAH